MTPVDQLLGDPSKCRRFTDDVAVHWYPTPIAETCWCGELKQNPALAESEEK